MMADALANATDTKACVVGLSVNDDGNIVLDVKPMGTVVIFR